MRFFCSRCGATLDANQTICNNCGRVLGNTVQRPKFYCRECYEVVGEFQKRCRRCGTFLENPVPDYGAEVCRSCGKKRKKLFEDNLCLQCAIKYKK